MNEPGNHDNSWVASFRMSFPIQFPHIATKHQAFMDETAHGIFKLQHIS